MTAKEKAPRKKKEKIPTIEKRLDDLEHSTEIYLWADIVNCCVLVQEIKCIFRNTEITPAKVAKPVCSDHSQKSIFSFDASAEPCDPAEEARTVDLHAACLDCEVLDKCERKDPYAGCLEAVKAIDAAVKEKEEPAATPKEPLCYCSPCKTWATCTAKPESKECKKHRSLTKTEEDPHSEGTCNNCQNSAVHVILNTCPCLEKGIRAQDLYEKTEATPCLFWGKREGPGGAWLVGKKPVLAWSDGPFESKGDQEEKGGCTNCGHFKGRRTFRESCTRLKDLMFKGGEYSAARLMAETEADGCLGWNPKKDKPAKEGEKLPYNPDIPAPSAQTCPSACPYRIKHPIDKFLICAYVGKPLIEMGECPTPVLKSSNQNYTINVIKEAIARQVKGTPSEDKCQCFTCPDGVMRCGIGDKACPHTKTPFPELRKCPQIMIPWGYLFPGEVKKTPSKKPSPQCIGCPHLEICVPKNPADPDCIVLKDVRVKKIPAQKKQSTKKPRTPKTPYGLKISFVPKDATALLEMGRKYATDITGPSCGNYTPHKTREDVIRSTLQTLEFWNKNKPITVTKATVRFEDKTGEFSIDDFFREDGTVQPAPKAEPAKKARKKKETT